ncbi:MAG: hypothetical protein HY675_16125 [Chloroflexi bacterium]|nr:hypothetical protein [Chloroflexota bacterium]
MKRAFASRIGIVVLVIVVATAAGLLTMGLSLSPGKSVSVSAAPLQNVTYSSSFQIQNLDSSGPAQIRIEFYDTAGTLVGRIPTDPNATVTIAAGSSQDWQADALPVTSGFAGSAVVISDKPIAAISNEQTSGPWVMRGAHDGVINTGTTMFIPSAMKNNSSYNSTLFIQNAGTADSTNTVLEYRDTSGALVRTDPAVSIKAGASYHLPLSSHTLLGGSATARFVGSVRVTSDQPLAVAANHTNDVLLYSTSGFASGAQRIFAPLMMNNNAGWNTDIMVMNVGTAAANVRFLKNGTTDLGVQWTLAPYQASYMEAPIAGMDRVGSLVVQGQSASDRLVGIVNERHTSGNAMSYKMFTGGTSKVFAPLIMNNNRGWYTSFQVQNVGTVDTWVKLMRNGTTQVDRQFVPAGSSTTWIYPLIGTTSGWFGAFSAEAETTTAQLAGIVNEQWLDANLNSYSTGDYSMVYEGTNQ